MRSGSFRNSSKSAQKRNEPSSKRSPTLACESRNSHTSIGLGNLLGRGRKIPKPKDTGMTIEASVADYLEFIKNKKRPSTYRRYRAVMKHVRAFFKSYTVVTAITPADIDSFRDDRLSEPNYWGRKNTPRNVNYEVATIRAFYYYLQKFRDPALVNPAARLKLEFFPAAPPQRCWKRSAGKNSSLPAVLCLDQARRFPS